MDARLLHHCTPLVYLHPVLYRRLFIVVTVLSLVLMVATAALWLRSYYGTDDAYVTFFSRTAVGQFHSFDELRLQGSGGAIFFRSTRGWASPRAAVEYGYFYVQPRELPWMVSRSGFCWIKGDSLDGAFHQTFVAVPFWLAFAVTSVFPALYLVRKRNNHDPLRCHCGYNLTGNVSGICPECGSKKERRR